MRASTAVIAISLFAFFSENIQAEEARIDEEELLEFLEESIKTCNVSSVKREGSDFRVIDLTNHRFEFSLKDVFSPKAFSGNMLQLKCGPPGCVAQYVGVAGKWVAASPSNNAFFRCDEDLVKRMKTIMRYYRKHYGD